MPAVLPLWQVYAAELRRMGYSAWAGKLNAADYGVPQTRERAILIASRVRQVARPEPTHYDPRKAMQLWGTPWVTMAEALGWGATGRPSPTVTAGGTSTGGAEPFGHRGRDALEAERDAGRWALRTTATRRTASAVSASASADSLATPPPDALGPAHQPGPAGRRQQADRRSAIRARARARADSKSGGQWVVKSFGNSTSNAMRRS